MDLVGVSHLQLAVRDVDVSERWYCDLFGFNRFTAGVADGRRYAGLRHKQAKVTIVLSEADADETGFSDHRIGLNHLALAVPTADALDEWIAHCADLGVRHDPVITDAAGGLSLILRDPDGIQLELFVAPPRSS